MVPFYNCCDILNVLYPLIIQFFFLYILLLFCVFTCINTNRRVSLTARLFLCLSVCLFGVFHSIRGFFTHLKTSSLPVKGCKFWPILGIYGLGAVRVRLRATPTVTRGINSQLRGPVTLTPLSLFERLRSVAAWIWTTSFRMRGKRSNPMLHRRCPWLTLIFERNLQIVTLNGRKCYVHVYVYVYDLQFVNETVV